MRSPEGAEWIEAADLRKGDVVFVGPQRVGVRIGQLIQEFGEEEVYDLEVEGAHSFLTEVCAVHDYSAGRRPDCSVKAKSPHDGQSQISPPQGGQG